YFFEASDRTWTGADFADEESTEAQRYYNYLCIAYGSDTKLFADFYDGQGKATSASGKTEVLPPSRAASCPKEYSDEKWAFDSRILPYVDLSLVQAVLAQDWLKPYTGP